MSITTRLKTSTSQDQRFATSTPQATTVTIALGTVGAVIAIIDPGSAFAAASVLTIAVFHLVAGWRTFSLGNETTIDLTAAEPTAVK